VIGESERNDALDGSFVPAASPGIVAVDADGEAVLVDEAHDHLHLLNSSGALLWQCFDGESSIADICFDLADELGVPFERILTDTLQIVDDLRMQGLVHDGRDLAPRSHDHDHDDAYRDQAADVPRHPRLLEEPPGG
jgi:coenzyme PQQ synthesis protein D (PqqD)